MKDVCRWVFCLGLLSLSPGSARAIAIDDSGFLPPSHEVFKPLIADPRELQYALRMVIPVSQRGLGEAAMGDYLGLYRWTLPGPEAYFQISIGGGVFGRFDISEQSNSLLVSDFYANFPFDYRMAKWSFRFMPYHTSSHLGDDYLKRAGITTTKHTWDNLRWLAAYDVSLFGRLYGGYTYSFRELPGHLGRNALQGGFEAVSPWLNYGHAQFYWANDFQSWERSRWNPLFNSQLGVNFAKEPRSPRTLSLFMEFGAGPLPQGQFFRNGETHWNFGIKFDLG